MAKTALTLTRGEQALIDRLKNERAEIARHTRRLRQHRMWRNQLIVKARVAGFSGRQIAPVVGISNVEISRIYRQYLTRTPQPS